MTTEHLWFVHPATEWTEALPLGNGRLGAMVHGGLDVEDIQLNVDTLWTGGPYRPINNDARSYLPEIRQLVLERRYAEAEALVERRFMAQPKTQMSYQPAGNLMLEFGHTDALDYRRWLDLDAATAMVEYGHEGVRYRRELFVSPAANVLVMHLTASRGGQLDFTLTLKSPQPGSLVPSSPETIRFHGKNRGEAGIEGRLTFAMEARVRTDSGTLSREGETLRVMGANAATILLDIETSFVSYDDTSGDPVADVVRRLDAASVLDIEALRLDHLAEHRRLYRRFDISLGAAAVPSRPIDERIALFAQEPDPALAALYVQFARYLMICSSRPGTQPTNLQGIWNKEPTPPWGSKYTANINLQMNYWLANPANLAECMEPLWGMVEDLAVTGTEMAQVHYGARGWMMHHNTDLWRATGPIDGAQWGMWPTGGAWLAVQLWDQVEFAGRPQALVERAYPLLHGALRFVLDVLQPLPDTGELVLVPSISPENAHPFGASICAGAAMDSQILRDLIDAFVAADTLLGRDPILSAEAHVARARLPSDRVGAAGQLQEWLGDWDMAVPEPNHRHTSHLYALFPSHQIDVDRTPSLAAAARRSLQLRGDESTGWATAWRLCLWARLRDADRAYDLLRLLLCPERTYPNLFDAHPPFQIDGNFGGAVGILELLVQSGRGEIHILPALPATWPDGHVKGLCARGGLTLDLEWQQASLTAARIISDRDQIVTVRVGAGPRTRCSLVAGRAFVLPLAQAALAD